MKRKIVWQYPPRKSTWLAAAVIGPATFIGALLFMVRLTSGFWD